MKLHIFIQVKIASHPAFAIMGDDLLAQVPVNPWDAALGCKLKVPTLDGYATMKLPAGLSSGKRLRLKGKGLPTLDGGKGDLYAEIKIVIPQRLSSKQKRLFKELKEVSDQPNM